MSVRRLSQEAGAKEALGAEQCASGRSTFRLWSEELEADVLKERAQQLNLAKPHTEGLETEHMMPMQPDKVERAKVREDLVGVWSTQDEVKKQTLDHGEHTKTIESGLRAGV